MSIVTIEEAQAKLSEMIHHLRMDEEAVIAENSRPVARLILIPPSRVLRKLGTLQSCYHAEKRATVDKKCHRP
mgnify:CR=1 FL=1